MSSNPRLFAAVVLLPFAAFSSRVVMQDGYTGFLHLAAREPWALQMLLDLGIALTFVGVWMVRDARSRGLRAWPWVLATLLLGSIGPLAYLVTTGVTDRARSLRST